MDVDTMNVDGILTKNGGDSMNTAIALAKLGADVDFGGMVGDDLFGRFLAQILEENGIDTSQLCISENTPTGSVIVLVQPDGNRAFLYSGGTNRLYGLDQIDFSSLNKYTHLHIGGTYQMDMLDGNNAAKLFKEARRQGLTTSMDVTWDPLNRWMFVIKPCLPHLDLFIPSDNEAKHITKTEDPAEMAECLINHGVDNAIIKLGKDGAYVREKDKEGYYLPAYKGKVVDTTGAGDSFIAGFLSRYVKGLPICECTKFAMAVATHCIREIGTTTGIPDEETIIKYLENYKKE